MKVLIADDDPVVLRLVERTVRRAGHDPVVAADGEQAWDRFRHDEPSMVISDWRMPGLDGLELCRRIRASDRKEVYFALMSSEYPLGLPPVATGRPGVDHFIPKSTLPGDLIPTLQEAAAAPTGGTDGLPSAD